MSTIKDIARYVGVSTATVSNALNGRANVSEDMRRRIMEAAEKMNYIPNISAKLMRGHKTNNIGLFLPYLSSTFYLCLIQEIYVSCLKKGYDLLVHISRDIESRDLLSNILSSNIDAAIILSDRFPNECIPMLHSKDVPVVFLDRQVAQDGIASVVIDEAQGMRQAVQYLASTGHRVIGHLHGILETYSAQSKLEAFRQTMTELGLPLYEDIIFDGHYDRYAAYSAVRAFLAKPIAHMPDAFVCADDDTALGCIRAFEDMGYNVPEDVSVTGCSCTKTITDQHLPLTRADYSMAELARNAVNILVEMCNHGGCGQILSIKTSFQVGETTRLRLPC